MPLVGNKWTLPELVVLVSDFIGDSENVRWPVSVVERAIRDAIRAAPPKWWEERIDSFHTYESETFRYVLPPACVRVEEVWFEPLSSEKPRYFVVPSLWHIEEDQLVFSKPLPKYGGQPLYMLYVVHPSNLLDVSANDGIVSSGTLMSETGTFITDGVRAGDAVHFDNDNAEYYVKLVGTQHILLLDRPATDGSEITYDIARYTDLPVTYIQNYAAAMLYENAARNRPGVEIDEALTLARYYRSLAEIELNKQRKTHTPRRRY